MILLKQLASSAVQITGSLSDDLQNLINTSDNTQKTNAQALVTGDQNVNITLLDNNITTANSGFVRLNNVAGATNHSGVITATVTGTAADINHATTGLGNLSAAAGSADQITFVVSADTGNDLTALNSVASKTAIASNSLDVASMKDSFANVETALANAKIDHADMAVTIDSTLQPQIMTP